MDGVHEESFGCHDPYAILKTSTVFCVADIGTHTFTYDKNTKRFLLTQFSSAAYVKDGSDTDKSDTDTMHAGTKDIKIYQQVPKYDTQQG